METFTSVQTGKPSYLLRMRDGRQVYMKDVTDRWTFGPKGLFSSVIGSGLIEGGFQFFNDLINKRCLSPNQYFWRAYMATLFGLVGGLLSTAVVMLAVAAGAPVIVGGLIGFGVGIGTSIALNKIRNDWINGATIIAGAM